jgi:hypothetical protein
MTIKMRAIRRIVTGNDEQGLSGVLFDSYAPNVNVGTIAASAGMTDIWVYQNTQQKLMVCKMMVIYLFRLIHLQMEGIYE